MARLIDQMSEEVSKLITLGLMKSQIVDELKSDDRFKHYNDKEISRHYNGIINNLRLDVVTNSADVFSIHIARYSQIIRNNLNLEPIDPNEFEDFDAYLIALTFRETALSNVLSTMKQKETLLGFHRNFLRVKITKRIIENSAAREIFTRERIEKTINNLTLQDRVRFLQIIKKCKINEDLDQIKLRTSESVILGEIEQNLYVQTELKYKEVDESELEKKYVNKSSYEVGKLIEKTQLIEIEKAYKRDNL